mmetsp:Transcript_8821/g.12499  ORF Transcript_8821/g.12499 Transcript_8821/m.12499 type:complete len:501 (-) Transcript_8821:292-1794(-)
MPLLLQGLTERRRVKNQNLSSTTPSSPTAAATATRNTGMLGWGRSKNSTSQVGGPSPLKGKRQQKPSTNGIADDRLRIAADRFYEFRSKLQSLDEILKIHLQDLKKVAKSRTQVMETLASVSRDTPLYECVGAGTTTGSNSSNSDADKDPISSTDKVMTYTSALQQHHDGHYSQPQLERFESEIVSYVDEWETTVSTRVATELKHIQNLHKTWDKYHQKVESLKASALKKTPGKKKSDLEEKISWNESKLRTAKKEYRRNLMAVTLFTEEVTDRGWKDLIPVMIRMIDYDNRSRQHASTIIRSLSKVREEMVELGNRYELDYETIRTGRLRVLLEEDAVDFVDPGDLQDLESTIAGGSIQGGTRTTYFNNSASMREGSRSPLPPSHHHVSRVQSTPPGPPKNNSSPMTENGSSQAGEDDEEEDDLGGKVLPPQYQQQQQQQQGNKLHTTKEHEQDAFEDSSACPNYPTSIYLCPEDDGGKGTGIADDETTLTGVPDMVSI